MADTKPEVALFVGGATLIGGIVLGKVVVDAIQGRVTESDSEPSALSDSIRAVASLVGLTVTIIQLPKAWDQAQKLLAEANL